jgi:hypothetical protein
VVVERATSLPTPTGDHKHPSEEAFFGPFVAAMALFGLSSAVRFLRRRILASTAFAVRFKATAIDIEDLPAARSSTSLR